MDWYTDYFCPMVHHYCDENNYLRRALLLLDSAPGHLQDTGKIRMTVDVKVEYLPQNATSLLQPMEQGIIVNLKAYYLHQTGRGEYCLGGGRGMLEKGTFALVTQPLLRIYYRQCLRK
jgi:hypothetical protein